MECRKMVLIKPICREGMGKATHSSILAWRFCMDRGAWQATVHGVARVGHDLVTKPPPVGMQM